MSFRRFSHLAAILCALSSSTISRATFPANAPRGWWFKVIEDHTESSGFEVKAQVGGNKLHDTAEWTAPIKWRKGDSAEFGLPDNRQDLWYVRKIHLQLRSLDDDRNVCAVLYYNDTRVKYMTFDSDDWSEEQEWCRPDDKDCPVGKEDKCDD